MQLVRLLNYFVIHNAWNSTKRMILEVYFRAPLDGGYRGGFSCVLNGGVAELLHELDISRYESRDG